LKQLKHTTYIDLNEVSQVGPGLAHWQWPQPRAGGGLPLQCRQSISS
jgi:hypothetical protein